MKKGYWGIAAFIIAKMLVAESVPAEHWTFKFEAPKKVYATGLNKHLKQGEIYQDRFLKSAPALIPGSFDLRSITPLSPILNQGNCGSCVYHSVTSNFADSWLLRQSNFGDTNRLSAEFLMNSKLDGGSRCNGSYFMATAPATAGGMPLFSDCPYNNGRKGCASTVPLHGSSKNQMLIDNSPKSIMSALLQYYPVSNTIGANGTFQGYQNGIFNACRNVGTNHETEIIGYSCETSIDKDGNCALNADGTLPNGIGYWIIRNSWDTSWGEEGFYRIKMTDSSGNRCNNVAEEVGIIETGVVPAPPVTPGTDWSKVLKIGAVIAAGLLAVGGWVAFLVLKLKK